MTIEATAPSSTVNLIAGSGVAPDEDTIVLNSETGKQEINRVPVDALADVPAAGLEDTGAGLAVKANAEPEDGTHAGIEVDNDGVRIKPDSNGSGKRYVGTDHTEVAAPSPGDIYYEISE